MLVLRLPRRAACSFAAALLVAAALPLVVLAAEVPSLRVATSGDYAPFSVTAADGRRAGLDIAVAERLARDLGVRVEWVRLAWPELGTATAAASFDVAMSGITMRADRAMVGAFTRPYATSGAMVLVRASDAARFADIDDLDRAGVRIAVNAGGHLEAVARRRFARAAITPIADNQAVPAALRRGDADAAVTDSAELSAWLAPDVVARGPFTRDYKAYLVPAARSALARRMDDWLRDREADGWLDAERRRWLGADAHLDAAAAARQAVAALIRLRLALMPDVAAAKRAAGLPIEDRGQEARVLERARAQAPSAPARAAAVFAELIEMAKAVQRAAEPTPTAHSLESLRAALRRIDTALYGELDRLPASPTAAWRAALADALPGADAAALDRLTAALAAPEHAAPPQGARRARGAR
ncbi:MAG: transporter substrate-binding domain-containing protein [Candidatus Binatia bacterium]